MSLVANPHCLAKYQSTNVLKPYLTELVDNGKIKDEDGVIKKFYKRGLSANALFWGEPFIAGAKLKPQPDEPKNEPQSITEDAKNSLASTWNRTKWHIDNGITQACEPKANACDDAKLVLTQKNVAQRKIEACIGFLADFPGCLERYKHDVSVAPYLKQLIDEKKIESVDGKITQQGPLETSKANQKRNVAVQARALRGGRSKVGSQVQSNSGAKSNPKSASNSQAAPAAPSAPKSSAAGQSSSAGGQAAQISASVAAPAASAPAIQKSVAVSQAPVAQKSNSPAPSAASPSAQMSRPAALSAVSVTVAAPVPSIAQNRGPSASPALMSGAESPAAKPSASAANSMNQPPVAHSAPVSQSASLAMPSARPSSRFGGAASNAEPAVPGGSQVGQDPNGQDPSGGSQSMQGQASHVGKGSSFDPTEMARQGVYAISQLQSGHAGQGTGTVGPGSPGYIDPALQPGQDTGLTGNAPTETPQDAGMAGSGSSEYVDPMSGPGASPVGPQMQDPGVGGSVPNDASVISNTFPADPSVASAIPSTTATAPNDSSVTPDDSPVVGAEGGVTGATVSGSSTGDGSAIPQAQVPGSAESGNLTVNSAGARGTTSAQNGAGTSPLASTQPAGTKVVAEQ